MIDYPIEEWFPTKEGQELANKLVDYIDKEVDEIHIDECILSLLENVCERRAMRNMQNSQYVNTCKILYEVRDKVKAEQRQQTYLVKKNGD